MKLIRIFMYKNKKISIVLTAHNEEKQIAKTVSSLPDFVDKIIVVNDASKDKTSEVMETIIDKPGKAFIDFTLGPNWKENLPEQQIYKKRYPRNPRELGQHLSYDPDIPMFAEGGIASLKK